MLVDSPVFSPPGTCAPASTWPILPRPDMDTILFVTGLLIALGAAALLFLGIIESGPAALIGIVGIGLIAASAGARAARGNA